MATWICISQRCPIQLRPARRRTMFFGATMGIAHSRTCLRRRRSVLQPRALGLSQPILTTIARLTSSLRAGRRELPSISIPAKGNSRRLAASILTRRSCRRQWAWWRLILIRTAGWIWRSRTRARRASACGGMWKGSGCNAFRCPISAGRAAGELQRSITTMTAGWT